MANLNPTPPKRFKPTIDYSKIGPRGLQRPEIYIQSPKQDENIWRKIIKYVNSKDRTIEEEYLLIEQGISKLPSIQRHYISIFVNLNTQIDGK